MWSKINSNDKNDLNLSSCKLLVIDEAHISLADTYKCIYEILQYSSTRLLGLTATPGRTDEIKTNDLADLFLKNLISLSDPTHNFDNPTTSQK